VDANEVDGLHLAYLFADSKDESDRFLSEGAIPMMNNVQNNPFKKSIDRSFLLKKYEDQYSKYFITERMSKEYLENSFNNGQSFVLNRRKNSIMLSEKHFVEKMDLSYFEREDIDYSDYF
jgi:hypothetical protein